MIDEIIKETQSYDKDNYIKWKNELKQKAYQLVDEALSEIKSNPHFLKQYFDVQSKFDAYTSRNALLILKQLPTAIQLRDKEGWREMKAKYIEKEPNKILLLEPGRAFKNAEGKLITPINAKEVIDISETNIKPTIRSYDKKIILQGLILQSPNKIKIVDSLENGKLCEWNQEDNTFSVCRNDDADLVISSFVTELAKSKLYESFNEIDDTKAKCISYMICKKYGIISNLDNIDKLSEKYSTMDNISIADDLGNMESIVSDINKQLNIYLYDKKKEQNNERQVR